MSKSKRKSKDGDGSLQLADSTQSARLLADSDLEPAESAASAASSSASASAGDSRGKSTGLETMLGKVFVDRGLVTSEELEACRAIQKQAGEGDTPRELADVLIDNDYITRRQLDRLRTELEAEKSTQQIPGYKIKAKLGHGAMATVFLARQLSLDRLVAIKVLPKKFSNNEKFIERFYKEGRAAAQLNHRNIVGAFDVGQAGDHHYFVMEYVDGETVYDRILKKRRFTEEEAIDTIRQVAGALKHAHEKGFIHRDIKPKNIMLGKDGVVKLADLGLARAVTDKEAAEAEAGRAYGTPYYISPEQIRGEVKIGPQADIYGLGATFYHMVTGKVPFDGKNPSSVMHKHLKQKLVPPDHVNPKLSAGTAQVIEMMLAKSRKDRYQKVDDLITDLEHIAAGEPPHFARAEHDLSGIASSIEEKAEAAPITVVDRSKSQSSFPINDPVYLATALVAGASVLINIVLLIVLAGSDPSPRATTDGETESRAAVVIEDPIVGTWGATSIEGNRYAFTQGMWLVFGSNGQASWIETWQGQDGTPENTTFDFPYQKSDSQITFNYRGSTIVYRYILQGDTLILTQNPDIRITLQRVQ